jgi:hypothetical protein
MSCEDAPCCGHEPGCCPDFDEDGRQLNMKCVCGASVPLNSRSSLCAGCLHDPECMGCDVCDPISSDYEEDTYSEGGYWDE